MKTVSLNEIRAFARRIAEEFKPKRIILFGSYAYGKPTEDSDVDLLVIFSGRGSKADKSLEIRLRLSEPFPMDLLTRSTGEVVQRLKWNDWFLHEVMEKGKVLYESSDTRMDRKSRRGLRHRVS